MGYCTINSNWKEKIFGILVLFVGSSISGRLRSLYLRMVGRQKTDLQFWIENTVKDDAFVVQIGSNDGKSNDVLNNLILRKKRWRVVFVEPVPYLFHQLKNAYPKSNRFIFENVAINAGKTMPFYWVDESAQKCLPDLPGWFSQLGSFNRQHITKHLGDQIDPFIVTTEIEGISLDTLFTRNAIQKIDVLQIDTEGYDWEILSQLNLKNIAPVLIIFEHFHLDAVAKMRSVDFLKEDYFVVEFAMDFLCIHKKTNSLSTEQVVSLVAMSLNTEKEKK